MFFPGKYLCVLLAITLPVFVLGQKKQDTGITRILTMRIAEKEKVFGENDMAILWGETDTARNGSNVVYTDLFYLCITNNKMNFLDENGKLQECYVTLFVTPFYKKVSSSDLAPVELTIPLEISNSRLKKPYMSNFIKYHVLKGYLKITELDTENPIDQFILRDSLIDKANRYIEQHQFKENFLQESIQDMVEPSEVLRPDSSLIELQRQLDSLNRSVPKKFKAEFVTNDNNRHHLNMKGWCLRINGELDMVNFTNISFTPDKSYLKGNAEQIDREVSRIYESSIRLFFVYDKHVQTFPLYFVPNRHYKILTTP